MLGRRSSSRASSSVEADRNYQFPSRPNTQQVMKAPFFLLDPVLVEKRTAKGRSSSEPAVLAYGTDGHPFTSGDSLRDQSRAEHPTSPVCEAEEYDEEGTQRSSVANMLSLFPLHAVGEQLGTLID